MADLARIVRTSEQLRSTRSRREKTALLADCLTGLGAGEVRTAAAYLMGELPQGRPGIGPAILAQAASVPAASDPTLGLNEVERRLSELRAVTGSGSQEKRRALIGGLFIRATGPEQGFLRRLILGELRQGALQGLMAEAVARAAAIPAAEVRRAVMVAGDVAAVAEAALAGGRAALAAYRVRLFQPLLPMLAQSAQDVDSALDRLGDAALEYKLDGARIQAHKDSDDVRVFTRRLNEVTAAVPEIVDLVRGLPARRLILDGEALSVRADGRPRPFQVTMRRFGRRADVEAMRARLPLRAYFFDCLYLDDEDLLDAGGADRVRALASALPPESLIPRMVPGDRSEARAFLASALARGHEGLMAKALDAPYESGSRGSRWLKVKQAHTLDLVVLAAEWGSGRRRGRLSNLHLGARDDGPGSGYVMLGKTFKGLTDEMLEWQTRRLQALALGREGGVVHVRPELVVEVAFDGIQASPHYPGGLALRFARVKAHRPDKHAADADSIHRVRALYARQQGEAPEPGAGADQA
ncbi:MAG: ATP-dependent DNA ligase [Chromatiales bacterium]|jgi:DNA ligase-1